MKNNIFLIKWALMLGVFLICLKSAHAYLDPGTGSLVLQILIGGIVTAGVVLKTKWNKVKSLIFQRIRKLPPG